MSNLSQYRYNQSDIQPRITQDEAKALFVQELAGAIATATRQQLARQMPPQQPQVIEQHYHQAQPRQQPNDLAQALIGFIVLMAITIGSLSTIILVWNGVQSLEASAPAVEDVA